MPTAAHKKSRHYAALLYEADDGLRRFATTAMASLAAFARDFPLLLSAH